MLKRLKNLFSSFHRHKEIGKAEDQKDSTNIVRPPTYSQPATQPLQSIKTFQPKDLWQTAYDQLDEKQQQILLRTQSSPESKDNKTASRELIDEIIHATKLQYEAYQQKSDNTLRKTSRKIIDALLSYKEIISAVARLDPTQHVASAWAVVLLGLERFYLDSDSDIRGHVETAMIKLYKAILHYSGQIRNSQERGVRRNLSDCFTAITGHPLTELKTSVEKERDNLRQWIELGGYLHHEKEAENLLLKIDELGESLKLLLERSSLMHLHVVEGALYDCHVHEHEDFCLPGTRTELLSRITDWAKSDDKFIFWLNGMAGTGKSTIARTVAQGFEERGLLGQLVTRHKQLVPKVLNAIKTDPRITSKFLRDQFDQLLYRPLLKLQPEQSTTIVIVIDALDECDGDADIKLILHLLFKLQEIKSVRLRVVLTSRPELPIRQGFDKDGNYQDLVLHELSPLVIERDIRRFLEYKLEDIREKRLLSQDWPGHDNIEKLVKMAVPLFIFASTACLSIGSGLHPQKQLQKYLDMGATSATQMEKTYLPALHQLMRNDEDESKENLEEFRDIVGVIILLTTPLSVDSLALLLQKPTREISDLLAFLHSVLMVPSNTNTPVRILHLSFRDFLLGTKGEFRIDVRETHRQIVLNCLRIMDTHLRHNICDLASYGIQREDIDPQIIQQRLTADLEYSCFYWVHHLKQSQGSISQSEILSFLQTRFLHWLEALALMGRISEAAIMIETLESSIWKKLDHDISGFLYDAKRFTLQNDYMAGIAPLQLYCSGLAFAPAQSVIKRRFLSEIPNQIQPLPAVIDSWSTTLQTLEGHSHSVRSVAFSPDGLTLASGSRDNTIKLWDTATGTQRQTLEGHSDWVITVAFSPDGLTLASGSRDNTIKIWDTATGTQRQTLEGHSDPISSVVFSPDGLTLVSGSDDSTIKLWDTATGIQRQTLEGHLDRVSSVAFSPDGQPMPTLGKAPGNFQISLSSNWVSFGGENLLWLPTEYRSFLCQATKDATLALGYSDGRVLLTGFHTHKI
ncbi:hypothetical protein N7463_006864 [Penicillium fimorum]|uniref:Mitochondrial division protein 1 n=1 Tax=Penicillium fimorum TaxID=1882269 RepID=A0A9X0C716_9EURO|nr:hypothetical protein N7463_006864 [Penicillium fimorum]